MSQNIELADFVAQLREELARALFDGKEQAIKFDCGPIELELEVAVQRAADTGAKIRFWVVDADASASLTSTHTQRIHMTLTPRAADRPNEPLHIAGESVAGEATFGDSHPDER